MLFRFSTPRRHVLPQFARFLVSGIPAFLVAIPMNWILVRNIGLPRAIAYALVLLFQMTLNFALCRRFVFGISERSTWFREFAAFAAGNSIIRTLDWFIYTTIVAFYPSFYILVQLGNLVVFSLLKYAFVRHVFSIGSEK